MIRIHSFDVFDTCLTRRVAAPADVFYRVGKRVFANLGIDARNSMIEDFVAARVKGEQQARNLSKQEDVTFDEIWLQVFVAMGWPVDKRLSHCELEVEEEYLVPIASTREKVQESRRQGKRIIFISDMYLPEDFIQRQLIKHGFSEPGDRLYVSGAMGKTKSTGSLFKLMLSREDVLAANVWHSGDNPQSDFNIPTRLGIRSTILPLEIFSLSELAILNSRVCSKTSSRIAGAMRAFRIGYNGARGTEMNDLASQFVAPFILCFATWVLQSAQRNGIKRLYFVSRDCQLVWKIAQRISAHFGGIDCRYLHISRQALFLPSASEISPAGMPWMRRSIEKPILRHLLAKLELTRDDVKSDLAQFSDDRDEAFQLKTEADWDRFWETLNQGSIKTRIEELIQCRRETARLYFQKAGLFDNVPWAMVDFGWYLTGQQSLWKLLKYWGRPEMISGYYLALKRDRVSYGLAGGSEAMLYEDIPETGGPAKTGAVFSNQTLLEHIAGCADHPSVHHYELKDGNEIGPAYTASVDPTSLRFCDALHRDVLAFVEQNSTLVDDFKDAATCRETLSVLTSCFFEHPTKMSARSLLGLQVAEDQNGLNARQIVKPLTLALAFLPMIPRRSPLARMVKGRDFYWQAGSLAISSTPIRKISLWSASIAEWRRNLCKKIPG